MWGEETLILSNEDHRLPYVARAMTHVQCLRLERHALHDMAVDFPEAYACIVRRRHATTATLPLPRYHCHATIATLPLPRHYRHVTSAEPSPPRRHRLAIAVLSRALSL